MPANTNNPQKIPINIVGGSTFGRHSKISAAQTWNMFISDAWLINFAGYKRILELVAGENGQGRALYHSTRGDFILAIVNSRVYRIDTTLNAVLIGSIGTSEGEVFVDENLNNQICIVDGIKAYIYNWSLAPNLTDQTLPAGLTPNYVSYHNTFFLFGNGVTSGNGAAWYVFSYATDTTITQTTELALQTKPDFARAVVRIPGQSANVLVFGTTVCEIHTNVGGIQNYRANKSVSIDYGCASVETIGASDYSIMWLAVNEDSAPVIMEFVGNKAMPISTDGIDYLMSQLNFPAKSTALFYRQDGHLFYELTFYDPTDNLTLMYDVDEKKFYNLSDGDLNYFPARQIVYFNKKSYFISLNNASLYEQSTDYYTYDENLPDENDENKIYQIQHVRIPDTVRRGAGEQFVGKKLSLLIQQGQDPNVIGVNLQNPCGNPIITETGVDIIAEDGQLIVDEESDNISCIPYQPRVDLSISKDGGVTYSTTIPRYLNAIGNRKNMVEWRRFGLANELTFQFRFWGNHSVVVNNAELEAG